MNKGLIILLLVFVCVVSLWMSCSLVETSGYENGRYWSVDWLDVFQQLGITVVLFGFAVCYIYLSEGEEKTT